MVTGGQSGIGRAIAICFAAEGANVVVNDISEDGHEVVKEIGKSGRIAQFKRADVSLEQEARELMEFAVASFGGLDILVNNAGVMVEQSVVTATDEDWHKVMDVNLRGAWYCCKYAIPIMAKSQSGSIVNISSTHSFRTQPKKFPYQASKAGMLAMTRGICVDFGEQGIRANSICPGFIMTPLAEHHMQQFSNREAKEKVMLGSHPLRRFGNPEDVAKAAVFLASDESAFISGATLVVDGGRSALQVSE